MCGGRRRWLRRPPGEVRAGAGPRRDAGCRCGSQRAQGRGVSDWNARRCGYLRELAQEFRAVARARRNAAPVPQTARDARAARSSRSCPGGPPRTAAPLRPLRAHAAHGRAHAARLPRRDGRVRPAPRRRLALAGAPAGGGRLPQRLRAVQPHVSGHRAHRRHRLRPRVVRPARVGRWATRRTASSRSRAPATPTSRVAPPPSRRGGSPGSCPPTEIRASRPATWSTRRSPSCRELVAFILGAAAAGDSAQQAVLARGDVAIYEGDIAYLERHRARLEERRSGPWSG